MENKLYALRDIITRKLVKKHGGDFVMVQVIPKYGNGKEFFEVQLHHPCEWVEVHVLTDEQLEDIERRAFIAGGTITDNIPVFKFTEFEQYKKAKE